MSNVNYPKFRWYVLVTMLIVTVAEGVVLIAPSPLVGEIAKSLNTDLGTVTGAVMGAFTLFVAISAILGGALVDKLGTVKIYIGSLLLLIVGSLLVPVLGKSLGMLILLRIIQGLGAGPIMSVGSRVAAEWFPKKERAIVTGIQGMGVSLGTAIGFGAAPAVFKATSSWNTAMAAMSVFCVIAMVLTIIMAMGPKAPMLSAEEINGKEGESAFKLAIKQPVTWLCIISFFLLSWIMQGYNDLTPGHIAVDAPTGLGYGVVIAGQMLMLLQIAFMVGSASSGFVLDKLFKGNVKPLIMLGYLLTGVFCVLVMAPFVYTSKPLLAICLILAGYFMGIPNATIMGFIARNYPENVTGKVGGMVMGLGIFGGTAGVAAGSTALHATGKYNISIIIIGVVAIFGMINATRIVPPSIYKYKEDERLGA